MQIQQLSKDNIQYLSELVLELWTGYNFKEEFQAYDDIVYSSSRVCYLVKEDERYIGFNHFTIRTDYVQGATELPVAYVEALCVKST
jgi:aminoglycoside 6'-N-acetyltransferase I